VGLRGRGRRAAGRLGAARDQRVRPHHRPRAQRLPRAQGRRDDVLRLLDLLRCLRGRRQPVGPAEAARRAGRDGAGVGLGVAVQPPRALQPRLRRPAGPAVERAQEVRVVGRGEGRVDRQGRAGLREEETAVLRAAGRRGRRRGPARRRPVRHAGRRQGLVVRAQRPAGRADAHALRAARVAVPQPALRAAGQPDAQGVRAGRQPLEPVAAGALRGGLPVRAHDLPAHRAPHGRRDEPAAAVPGRAAAGDVRRGVPRPRARVRPRAPRLGDRRHEPRRDRVPRAGATPGS
jgi:hypothetical protein